MHENPGNLYGFQRSTPPQFDSTFVVDDETALIDERNPGSSTRVTLNSDQ